MLKPFRYFIISTNDRKLYKPKIPACFKISLFKLYELKNASETGFWTDGSQCITLVLCFLTFQSLGSTYQLMPPLIYWGMSLASYAASYSASFCCLLRVQIQAVPFFNLFDFYTLKVTFFKCRENLYNCFQILNFGNNKNSLTQSSHISGLQVSLPFNPTSKRLKGNRSQWPFQLVTFMLTLKIGHAKSCLYYA